MIVVVVRVVGPRSMALILAVLNQMMAVVLRQSEKRWKISRKAKGNEKRSEILPDFGEGLKREEATKGELK
jgi:hypothetical protein